MKRRPPSSPVVNLVPALIAKRGKGGTSFQGADQYDQGKVGSQLLATNLEGQTPKARGKEIASLLAGSRLKRICDHWSISLDPRLGKLTDDQWREVGRRFSEQMGFSGCAFTLTRHTDEPQDHIHLTLLRIRPDRSTVSDSNDFKRSHEAVARCAAEIGLTPLPPRPNAALMPSPTDAQVAANKRANGRRTNTQHHAAVTRIFNGAVSEATSLAELQEMVLKLDVELQVVTKTGGAIQGLNVRHLGGVEWIKGSNLRGDRSLSWPKVEARLAANLDLQRRARVQADLVAQAARTRAEQAVAARLERDQHLVQSIHVSAPGRSLSPAAIISEITTMSQFQPAKDDALSFLTPTPPARPADVGLDDVALAPAAPVSMIQLQPQAETEQNDQDRRDRAARDDPEAELDTRLRAMSADGLYDLKSYKVDPTVLQAEQILALLSLLARVLSLGRWRPVSALTKDREVRQALAARAATELDRRRRSPQGVRAKMAALADETKLLTTRQLSLTARRMANTELSPSALARARFEQEFDRVAATTGAPTIHGLRTKLAVVDAQIESNERAMRELEEAVPTGFAGILLSRSAATRQVQAQLARVRASAERSKVLRERMALALEQLLDEFEKRFTSQIQAESERIVEERMAAKVEIEQLQLELRTRIPAEMRELEQQSTRERLNHLIRDSQNDPDANQPASVNPHNPARPRGG